eukprot:gene17350-23654_t
MGGRTAALHPNEGWVKSGGRRQADGCRIPSAAAEPAGKGGG